MGKGRACEGQQRLVERPHPTSGGVGTRGITLHDQGIDQTEVGVARRDGPAETAAGESFLPHHVTVVEHRPFDFIETMNNVESAEAAGDHYPVATCQITDGVGTMVGAVFGSPFPTTAYIGHPAYKRMGAHAGYIIGVGAVIPLAAFFGLLAFLNNLIPVAAAAPVLVFVALSLITNTAHSVKTEHMSAVTIAMMPHVSAFLMVKWGSLMGALGAVGVAALPQLGDAELTAALLQQGAHFEGHLALSQGAILTGLIWGAIVASVIDGNFRNAGGFALAAAAMSAFGIIHGASLHWPELSGVTAGYLISAAFLLIYPLFHKEDELVNENVVIEEAPTGPAE